MIKKLLIWGANFIYLFFKLFHTKEKITMISRQTNKKGLDFSLLEEKIKEKSPEITVCVLCKKLEGGAKAKISEKIKYIFHCIKQMYHIATSKVVVLDSYCILISILKHKKSLKVIQMWHSMGTMKKFGYQILGMGEGSDEKTARTMRMHKNYDYAFASSKEYAKELAEGFGCDVNKIKIFPLPRVDLLASKEYKEKMREKVASKYPEILTKKNIVYCPTFRKDEKELQEKVDELINNVDSEKYNLILKMHPLSKVKIETDRAINDKEFSTMEMLFVADYVISDYSCIIYEAAILNIPLFFYCFDLQHYLDTRGLTIDYKTTLPGIASGDIKPIIEAIENEQYDMEELKRFKEKYIANTENCTENIANFIFSIM